MVYYTSVCSVSVAESACIQVELVKSACVAEALLWTLVT